MLLLAVILAIFVYGMTAATLGTILPDLSERFHLTPSQNGNIAFAQALGLILASLAVGPLLDAEGKKVGLVLGLSLISIALLALPRCKGYRHILLLLFLLGVGGGIVITGANALASDVGEAHRASTLNLVNLFFGLGGFVTPFIAANFSRKIGFGSATRLPFFPSLPWGLKLPPECPDLQVCTVLYRAMWDKCWAGRSCFYSACFFFSTSPAKLACGTGCLAI